MEESTTQCIQRLIKALKYYQTLDIDGNTNHCDLLVKFCVEVYKFLLDDFIYIVTNHNNDIQDIYNLIITQYNIPKCNIKNCSLLDRYYRNRNNDNKSLKSILNKDVIFYRDLLDSIHCYLIHLYDVGLRIQRNISSDDSLKNESKNENYFDAEFSNICGEIDKNKKKLRELDTFNNNRLNNNKFNINVDKNQNMSNTKSITFIDGLFSWMMNDNLSDKQINRLKSILNDEQYDTDTLLQDTKDDDNQNSNIAQYLGDFDPINSIKEYIKWTKLSDTTFSIGYIFYYWDYYKQSRQYKKEQFAGNKNDHSGYSPQELYIIIKYSSLKEEILNNTICTLDINEFNVCLEKAMKYIDTMTAKAMVADKYGIIDKELHYNIKKGTSLSYLNLLSIILYCDETELCTAFSSTFRKTKPYEPLTSIKNKNSEYGNWSKLLRETVEYFGQFGYYSRWDKKKNDSNNHVSGPFYCGMSFVMVLPQFNIRLCAPTSTSKKVEVAIRFAGDKGVVLQINNNGSNNSWALTQFSCSWISRYSGEDEWLFMGGRWPIKLEGIRNIVTRENYEIFIKPLYWFDCMITGTSMWGFEPKINNKHCKILNDLMDHKLGVNGFKNEYPRYINDTFEAFINHKTQIVLNLHYIYLWFGKLKDLIMNLMTRYPQTVIDDDGVNNYNLFKDLIFSLFKNVNHIIIHSTRNPLTGYKQYVFNILSLLTLIDSCSGLLVNDMKITVNALHEYEWREESDFNSNKEWEYVDVSWIYKEWNKSSKTIKSQFNAKKWNICFEQTTNGLDLKMKQDSLLINRI